MPDVGRPSVFLSYAHEDAIFAHQLANAMKGADLEVWVDDGELRVGDSIIRRVSEAIHTVDFLVALVSDSSIKSNWCQKELALAVTRGLDDGRVTVLPVRLGKVTMPMSLGDAYHLRVGDMAVSEVALRLVKDISGHLATTQARRPSQPLPANQSRPVPPAQARPVPPARARPVTQELGDLEPIRIIEVDVEGVGRPRNDGTPGSALYSIPLRLSRTPSAFWAESFQRIWDFPPKSSSMHRPGIGSVIGNRIVLDGTTMEELESTHRETLRVVIDAVNERVAQAQAKQRAAFERQAAAYAAQDQEVRDAAARLKFD